MFSLVYPKATPEFLLTFVPVYTMGSYYNIDAILTDAQVSKPLALKSPMILPLSK